MNTVLMDQTLDKSGKPKRTYRGVSPAQRAETRRRQLVDAGIQVYGELGYRNAGVKAVCAAAGLTDRYFYEAFANSEALLAACFEAITGEVIAEIMQAGTAMGDDREARAKAMLLAYFGALRRKSARARVFLVEMTGISPAIDAAFSVMLDQIGGLIIETLDPERLGPLAVQPLLARGVASGLIGIASQWVQGGYAEPAETAAQSAFLLCKVAVP